MMIIQNKEDMISYYPLKKIEKKVGEAQKLGKNWYYMHFDTKKYTKNYKMRVIQNKEDRIYYYQLKTNLQKMRKFDKKLVLYAF